ncbi:MAG: UDP-N-acetylmuramoyl-L-alanyl-D-glutamate--2,6-diaminopimelate ligase [Candidatus Doudnabacteria bacterium]|jgi:UDP-N-acetylmuramoyl-L-alanyl-D-glutamate--2,6-diaminopimelate ligase
MNFIKALIPSVILKIVRPWYHGAVALMADYYFDEPSKELTVIGITGTAGKSTTTQMLAKILNTAGKKCGFITTVSFFDGESETINKHGLSMPGGWLLQKQLLAMKKNGCKFAVVECTSEGLAQNRHLGIDFDYAVFTNLSPAHMQAHGGWENYKAAKGKLFKAVGISQTGVAKKTIVANLDDDSAEYFLAFPATQKLGISFTDKTSKICDTVYQAHQTAAGFSLGQSDFVVHLLGEFNKFNGTLAVVTAQSLGVSVADCQKALGEFKSIPGRMEEIQNNQGFRVFVDYGCEPASFTAALKAAFEVSHKKLIHVFGSTGGHRDSEKRFLFGQTSARLADQIIITNDDVYGSDPEKIAQDIESGIKSQELWKGSYSVILDRREAIRHALSTALAGDLVLITGKGSEQFLVLPGNERIAWDDREVVKQEFKNMGK